MEKSVKILFADDNRSDVQTAINLLQKHISFESAQVDQIAEIGQLLAEFEPDLVITDLTLLDGNGLDVVKAAKSHRPDLPVIVLTGSHHDTMVEACYQAGISAHVLKSDLKMFPYVVKNTLDTLEVKKELQHFRDHYGNKEGYLCQYVNFAPDGICLVDSKGHFLEVNLGMEEITGLTRFELTKMRIHDLLDAASPQTGFKDFEELLSHGDARGTVAFRCKNNKLIWLNIIAVKLPNGHQMGFLSDVTASMHAEKEVLFNETRFRNVLEQSQSVVWECDPNGLITYISPMCHLIVGHNPDEIVGQKHIYDFQFADDIPKYRSLWMQSLKERRVFKDYIHKIVDKNGNIKYVSATGSPLFDETGVFIGYRGVDHDVSARVASDIKLQQSEARLRALLEAAQDSVYLIDPSGIVLACNDITARYFGLSYEQVIGTCLYDHLSDDTTILRREMIKKVCETAATVGMEEAFGDRWVYRRMFPVIREGVVESVAVYAMDITEIKLANEANQMLASRLSAITEAVNDAIVMIDHEGLVSFWNKSAEKIFGYTEMEMIGRNLHDVLAPETYQKLHQEAFRIFQQTGRGAAVDKTVELKGLSKYGHEIPIELSISALRYKEKWASVGIIRDITSRKQTEDELMTKIDELERFNKLTIDRELRMIALKQEVNLLLERAGFDPKYVVTGLNQTSS